MKAIKELIMESLTKEQPTTKSMPEIVKRASEILKNHWENVGVNNNFHKRNSKGGITVDYTTDSKEEAVKLANSHVAVLAKQGIQAKPRVTKSDRYGVDYWYHGVNVVIPESQ